MTQNLATLFAACLVALLTNGTTAAQDVLYETTFETAAGWTFSSNQYGDFGVDATIPPGGTLPPSPPNSLRFLDLGFNGGGGWAIGSASSPVIDLSGSTSPQVTFWLYWDHEIGCSWDELSFIVTDASTGVLRYSECLSQTTNPSEHRWSQFRRTLDPAWGQVNIWFSYDAWDWLNAADWGFLVDDFRVLDERCGTSTLCVAQARVNLLPGPTLRAHGDAAPTTTSLHLVGAGFPVHTFAVGFIGPDSGILPAGRGIRCIAAGTSRRLAVAPTRAGGAPRWTLDLTSPALAPMVQVGQPFFIQTMYRDGGSINFSEAIRIDVCD